MSPNLGIIFLELFFVFLFRGIELASLLPPHFSNHFYSYIEQGGQSREMLINCMLWLINVTYHFLYFSDGLEVTWVTDFAS